MQAVLAEKIIFLRDNLKNQEQIYYNLNSRGDSNYGIRL